MEHLQEVRATVRLGKQRLDGLRVARVQGFLNQQIKVGHSLAKVHIMRTVLGAALTRAMREELLTVNVARLTTLAPAPKHKVKPWSADEARAFLAVARDEPLYPAFTLLMLYGLRRGEVLGSGWEDADMDKLVMRIEWQLQRVNGQLTRTQVKTDAGVRDLPMLPLVWESLIELAERQMYARRRAGIDWQERAGVRHQERAADRTSKPVASVRADLQERRPTSYPPS